MADLSASERRTLDDLAIALRATFGDRIERLALFGSRARGEGRDDSDLDVCLVVRDGTRAERRFAQDLAADISVSAGLVLSPLFVASADWSAHPLRDVIAREGRTL